MRRIEKLFGPMLNKSSKSGPQKWLAITGPFASHNGGHQRAPHSAINCL